MITWLFSDRGTPKSYRMQEGFGVNTYVWVNAEGKAVYVKYHLTKSEVGHNILAGSVCPKATETIHRLIKRPKHIQKIERGG